MNHTNDGQVHFLKNEEMVVCFVNTLTPPTKVERHSLFKHSRIENEEVFQQLCTYSYTNENATYSLQTWERINVPICKQSLFILACDAMTGLSY